MITSPSLAPSTIFLTSSPIQSGASVTSCPNNSPIRSAHGPRLNLSSGPSLGRPKCEHTVTMAPLPFKYSIVGMDDRIRVSSVIFFPSRGTFTSQRTRTFFPLRSDSDRSSMDFLASSSKVGDEAEKVRTPRAGADGANADTAGRAKRATQALMSFMVYCVGL